MYCRQMAPSSITASRTLRAVCGNQEVWSYLLDLLEKPYLVFRLRLVSHYLRDCTDRALERRYDVERFLYPVFGQDVRSFRDIQRLTGALVGGSWAVSFFQGTRLPKMGPPDVFVQHRGLGALAYFLESRLGALAYFLESHRFVPKGEVEKRCFQNETMVVVRRFAREEDGSVVNVYATPESPIATIMRSYITVTFNFIGWDWALSLYPAATFCSREGLVLDAVDGDQSAVERYTTQRGFTLHEKRVSPSPWYKGSLATGRRVFGDRHTWTIPLQTPSGVSKVLPCIYSGNSFALSTGRLSGSKGGLQGSNFYVKFDTVQHEMLQHTYVASEPCARYIMLCLRAMARGGAVNTPSSPWICYFFGGSEDIEINSCDSLIPELTEAWMISRMLVVATELLMFRFDPELM
ncbi:hypothetical protein AURDEDRAFT_176521 [Auricularia subglabra TFB-10046 SS5]|uniref:Uncharacterized protein n=1 Tax=Auricularia subglabra (strain TFB-10046 / SS5) TaxID=717982 RepID=J0D6E4_AURST|nr:hypothetical protein AURDEDRAFT_176521 [Auricularia subglabra TFB-10046 SS5]